MNSKKIIEKLFTIATNQQKIIEKIAQAIPENLPTPARSNPREAQTILDALPPNLRMAVSVLEVHDNVVKIRFVPGKGTDAVFNAIQQVVKSLQQSNKLTAPNYTITEV